MIHDERNDSVQWPEVVMQTSAASAAEVRV
jgi:hypothetical protein